MEPPREPSTDYVAFDDAKPKGSSSILPQFVCASPRKEAKTPEAPEGSTSREAAKLPVQQEFSSTPKMTVLRHFEQAARATDEFTSGSIDKAANTVTDGVLSNLGEAMCQITSDYFYQSPDCLRNGMRDFSQSFWKVTSPVLRQAMIGSVSGDYNWMLIQAWTTEFPHLWPRYSRYPLPWAWLRARYLHAYYPADQSLFGKMRNPLYTLIMLLKMSSYTSVPTFLLQFLFIDKSDEFQVANLILSFKSYQFLTALYYATSLAYGFYTCLGSSSYLDAIPRSCDVLMPSSLQSFDLFMLYEIPRLATLLVATALLRGGWTFGGQGELRALAEVRLDMADGKLDGFANTARIALNQVNDEDLSELCHDIDFRVWRKHLDVARKRYRAEVGTGGYLATMMLFDFAVLALATLLMFWMYAESDPRGGTVVLKNTLFYISITWALCSWPFLIFHFPILGPALSTPYLTGYSTLGVLVPQLSSSSVVAKDELAAKRAQEKEALQKDSIIQPLRRWWHFSTARRVVRGVVDVINPFDNIVNTRRIV